MLDFGKTADLVVYDEHGNVLRRDKRPTGESYQAVPVLGFREETKGADPFLRVALDKIGWTDEARHAAFLARQRNAAQNDAHGGLAAHGWELRGQAEGMLIYQNPFFPKQQIGVDRQGDWTHQDWSVEGGKTVSRGFAPRTLHRHLQTWRHQ